jgi:ferredoxin-NADP reductase
MKNAIVSSIQGLGSGLFLLRLSPEGGLEFRAGQFIIVHLPPDPQAAPGSKPPKGFYSLASAQHRGGELEILVEKRGGYVSEWMCARQVGDTLQLEGPLGKFSLADPGQDTQLFLGSKAGLAPLRSMIQSLLHSAPQRQLQLFLGGEPLFDGEWRSLAASTPRFHYHPSSDPAAELIGSVAERDGLDIYLAGFNAEVEPMLASLLEAGFDKACIKVEKFG